MGHPLTDANQVVYAAEVHFCKDFCPSQDLVGRRNQRANRKSKDEYVFNMPSAHLKKKSQISMSKKSFSQRLTLSRWRGARCGWEGEPALEGPKDESVCQFWVNDYWWLSSRKTVLRKEWVVGVHVTEISSKHQGLRAQSGYRFWNNIPINQSELRDNLTGNVKFSLTTRCFYTLDIQSWFPSEFRDKLWLGLGLGVGVGIGLGQAWAEHRQHSTDQYFNGYKETIEDAGEQRSTRVN